MGHGSEVQLPGDDNLDSRLDDYHRAILDYERARDHYKLAAERYHNNDGDDNVFSAALNVFFAAHDVLDDARYEYEHAYIASTHWR